MNTLLRAQPVLKVTQFTKACPRLPRKRLRPRSQCRQTKSRRHASSNSESRETPKSASTGEGPQKSSQPQIEPEPFDIPQPTSLWYSRLPAPVTDFFSWFHKTQGKRPLTVQLTTTLITYLCGDLLAQEIGGEKYDPLRTLRMLVVGGLASVPGYKWFLYLGSHFNYPSLPLSILTKVIIQQSLFTPVFNTYFFGLQAVLTGESPSGVIERVKKCVPTSMYNSLKLWPAVTAFSFAFVRAEYRFMFSGIFAVCWQSYLSFLNRKEEKLERVGNNMTRALREFGEEREREKRRIFEEVKREKVMKGK